MMYSMEHSGYSSLSSRASSPADRLAKAEKQTRHLKELWMFLGGIMALLTCIRFARLLWSWASKRTQAKNLLPPASNTDVEADRLPAGGLLYRCFSAFSTAFRVVLFRWTIPIGPQSVASVSELAFIFCYIAAMFAWLLADSASIF